jgi:hypothetical protein
MLPLRQINPTGKSLIFVSSPISKNIPLNPSGKSSLRLAHPVPGRGALAIVTNVGTGCGGRGGVGRVKGSQGGLSVSEHNAQDERR